MAEVDGQVSGGDDNKTSGDVVDNKTQADGNYPKDFVEKLKKEKLLARAEAEELKKKLADKESSELEKSGKLNELVELERTRNKELEEKSKTLSNTIIQRAVLSAAKSEADKMGAQYFEVVQKMLDTSKIDVNPETLEVDASGIRAQIMEIKSKMPLLFRTEAPRTNDLPPGGGKPVEKPLSQMTNDELKELLKNKI